MVKVRKVFDMQRESTKSWDVCCKNASFNIFVVIIPKEGLVDGSLPILLLVWHRLCNITSKGCRIEIYSQCHTERRIVEASPGHTSFRITPTKILKEAFYGMWLKLHHNDRALLQCESIRITSASKNINIHLLEST